MLPYYKQYAADLVVLFWSVIFTCVVNYTQYSLLLFFKINKCLYNVCLLLYYN